jgi:hypothetical protein
MRHEWGDEFGAWGTAWRQSEERAPLWAAWNVRGVARSGVDVLVVIGGARVRTCAAKGGEEPPGRGEGRKSARGAERGSCALMRAAPEGLGKWWMCAEM